MRDGDAEVPIHPGYNRARPNGERSLVSAATQPTKNSMMKRGGIAVVLALVVQSLAAVELEFTESVGSSISDAQRRTIQDMAASIENEVRGVLPGLPTGIVVEVRAEERRIAVLVPVVQRSGRNV